jgi:hypothetical protein
MSKKSVIEFYEAVVSPLLTYASEIKPDTSMTKKIIETTGTRTQRNVVGHQMPRY